MRLTAYTVDENEDGFIIRTSSVLTQVEFWVGVLWCSFVVWFLFHLLHAPRAIQLSLPLIPAIALFVYRRRTFRTTTTITRLEATPTGDFPSYTPPASIPLAEIRNLSWHPTRSDGDNTLPQGLWADYGRTGACLVPSLDPQQAHALIARIEKRFGYLLGAAIGTNPSTGGLTSLGLHTPHQR